MEAQNKVEREIRIDEKEVPSKAVTFVSQLNFTSKIKWYQEFGLKTTSFEAKTKFQGKVYSIEFNKEGTLEDIEIELQKKQLPVKTYQNIKENLKSEFGRFRIRKIQVQYSGEEQVVIRKISNQLDEKSLITRYEIVVSAKVDNKFKLFEFLFTNTGDFIQRKTILPVNTDNLEY